MLFINGAPKKDAKVTYPILTAIPLDRLKEDLREGKEMIISLNDVVIEMNGGEIKLPLIRCRLILKQEGSEFYRYAPITEALETILSSPSNRRFASE